MVDRSVTGPPPSRVLGWSEVARSTAEILRLSYGIVLGRKLRFLVAGVLVYHGLVYLALVLDPREHLSLSDALGILVEFPGAVIAIYLCMDLVARERDRQTLETLFSTASSHYTIWSVRLFCIYSVLFAALLVINTLAFFFFAEVPLLGGVNAFVPAFLFANVTFAAAVRVRGANTAAMIAAAILVGVLMTAELLAGTAYWVFLNPFAVPMGSSEYFWAERIFLNRAGILVAGGLLAFLALRRMERREAFLG